MPLTSHLAPQVIELPLDFKRDRLDKVLAQYLPEHSRTRIQQWIEAGYVTVNGQAATIRQVVRAGDRVWVQPQPTEQEQAFLPQEMGLDVVAETPDVIILNKPAGLVTHPGAGNWQGTLLNGLLFHYPELAQVARAGIVHRLDKDTSGILMIARHEVAHTHLVRQLQARTVERSYMALVKGHVMSDAVIDRPIGRDRRVAVRMSVDHPIAAKEARTRVYAVRQGWWQGSPISLLRCALETGRTHQIRVHLASVGHPLLGDELYGGPVWAGATRQMLHAHILAFDAPSSSERLRYTCPIATDMDEVNAQIEWSDQCADERGDDDVSL